uniref:hypothetical protein n=1 Tax=Psychromonas sp. TaxID=1884585 RepID=UPI003567C176
VQKVSGLLQTAKLRFGSSSLTIVVARKVEGQEVKVKVLEVDRQGRVRLSIKEAMEKKEAFLLTLV